MNFVSLVAIYTVARRAHPISPPCIDLHFNHSDGFRYFGLSPDCAIFGKGIVTDGLVTPTILAFLDDNEFLV